MSENALCPDPASDGGQLPQHVVDPPFAWEELESRFSRQLQAYFRRLPCRDAERRELVLDVLAEVFASSSEGVGTDALSDRIKRTARLRAKKWMRLLRRETRASSTNRDVEDVARTGEESDSRVHMAQYLESLLSRLPLTQRAALERHVLDDQDDLTIAREIGCSIDSVRVLRHRAKCKLRLLVLRGEVPPPPAFGDDP